MKRSKPIGYVPPGQYRVHKGMDIGKRATQVLHSSPAQATNDDDLVEVLECKECTTELKGEEAHEWELCAKHMPDFDAVFTVPEYEIYDEKHHVQTMIVGLVRHLKELEMVVDNLQEQIIELGKGDN